MRRRSLRLSPSPSHAACGFSLLTASRCYMLLLQQPQEALRLRACTLHHDVHRHVDGHHSLHMHTPSELGVWSAMPWLLHAYRHCGFVMHSCMRMILTGCRGCGPGNARQKMKRDAEYCGDSVQSTLTSVIELSHRSQRTQEDGQNLCKHHHLCEVGNHVIT